MYLHISSYLLHDDYDIMGIAVCTSIMKRCEDYILLELGKSVLAMLQWTKADLANHNILVDCVETLGAIEHLIKRKEDPTTGLRRQITYDIHIQYIIVYINISYSRSSAFLSFPTIPFSRLCDVSRRYVDCKATLSGSHVGLPCPNKGLSGCPI